MKDLVACAEKIAKLLTDRKQTIAIAESSTGGLISAALLAVPGASAYFLGGGVVYTRQSRRVLFDVPDAALEGLRPSTEPYALLMARTAQRSFSSTWALAETGATGPTGNRYGDAAGHSCIAVAGAAEGSMTLETGISDRQENMHAFTIAALTFLLNTISR
jgi:nicotinamide-nucleotide amidase